LKKLEYCLKCDLFNHAYELSGSEDVVQRAKEVVKQKLETHNVEPLDRDIVKMLEKMISKQNN